MILIKYFSNASSLKSSLISLSLLFVCYFSTAQIAASDIKRFGSLVHYRSQFEPTVKTTLFGMMQRTFPNHTYTEIYADIEMLESSINVFDKFIFELTASLLGDREMTPLILKNLCGEAVLSLKIFDYIKTKYNKDLTLEINKRKEDIRQREAIANEERIKRQQEKEIKQKQIETERIAKEEARKSEETIKAKQIHEIKMRNYNLKDFPSYDFSFKSQMMECLNRNLEAGGMSPSISQINKLNPKSWRLDNSYQIHYKMINPDTSDDKLTRAYTEMKIEYVTGSDSTVRFPVCDIKLPVVPYSFQGSSISVMSEYKIPIKLSLLKGIANVTTNGYKAGFSKNGPGIPNLEDFLIKSFFKKFGNQLGIEKRTFKIQYEVAMVNDVNIILISLEKFGSVGIIDMIISESKSTIK